MFRFLLLALCASAAAAFNGAALTPSHSKLAQSKVANVAMSAAVDEVMEKLKSMTLLEASELVKAIEETFDVDASAGGGGGMMMMAPGAAGGGADAGAAVEEKTEFDIVLESFAADKKIAVLKVRQLRGAAARARWSAAWGGLPASPARGPARGDRPPPTLLARLVPNSPVAHPHHAPFSARSCAPSPASASRRRRRSWSRRPRPSRRRPARRRPRRPRSSSRRPAASRPSSRLVTVDDPSCAGSVERGGERGFVCVQARPAAGDARARDAGVWTSTRERLPRRLLCAREARVS